MNAFRLLFILYLFDIHMFLAWKKVRIFQVTPRLIPISWQKIFPAKSPIAALGGMGIPLPGKPWRFCEPTSTIQGQTPWKL